MKRKYELVLSVLTAVLATAAATFGLVAPDIYRDAASVLPQAMGQDVITLAFAVPLLVLATIAMQKGSLRGRLLWLGALGYLVYTYGTYALWARWNPLFLIYVALFGLSLYAVALGLVRSDAIAIRAALGRRAPVRVVASYLFVTALLVSALWLAEEVQALLRQQVPPSIVQLDANTNVVHVFDLAVVMPAFVITAVLLRRGRPWGAVLAAILLVKAATIGLAVLAMIWFMARAGFPTDAGYAGFFIALTVSAAGLAWWFLASLPRREVWAWQSDVAARAFHSRMAEIQ